MKRTFLNPLIILGTVLLVIAIFIGGWLLLNNLLAPYLPYGTRTLFQQAARVQSIEYPVAYVGAEKCRQCHQSTAEKWLHSAHNTVTCENCHGTGSNHVKYITPTLVNTSVYLCLTCHDQLASRPDTFPQVNFKKHSGGLPCLDCHNPMHPEITALPQILHTIPEGTDCLVCHGSSGLKPMPANHEQRTTENCTQCHRQGG